MASSGNPGALAARPGLRVSSCVAADDGRKLTKTAPRRQIDFGAISRAALASSRSICRSLLPYGKVIRGEYVALNPRRADRHRGSFKVNLRTGKWCDFACHDAKGRDLISLVAYVENCSQAEAARRISRLLGLELRS